MAGYWKAIRTQALGETLDLVRLRDPGRIVLWGAILFVSAVTASTLFDGAKNALAVVGITFLVGLAIYLVKLCAIPPRLADAKERDLANVIAERDRVLRALEAAGTHRAATRDPDGIYQWNGERVGAAHEVLPEIMAGRITIGTLETTERFSEKHAFEYREFKLRFVRCGGGGGVGFGVSIGGVERQQSFNGILRNVVCRITD